jgi:hypothetical protein
MTGVRFLICGSQVRILPGVTNKINSFTRTLMSASWSRAEIHHAIAKVCW